MISSRLMPIKNLLVQYLSRCVWLYEGTLHDYDDVDGHYYTTLNGMLVEEDLLNQLLKCHVAYTLIPHLE